MARLLSTRTVHLDVSYSQFLLRTTGDLDDLFVASALTGYRPVLGIVMTTAQQHAELRVDVAAYDGRPDDLGGDWRDVVEISVESRSVLGFDELEGDGVVAALPTEVRGTLRLRYAISDMDGARIAADDVRSAQRYPYRIDVWPEPMGPARNVRTGSDEGRYWKRAGDMETIRMDIHGRGGGTTEQERVLELVRRFVDLNPEVLGEVRRDPDPIVDRLANAAFMLHESDAFLPDGTYVPTDETYMPRHMARIRAIVAQAVTGIA